MSGTIRLYRPALRLRTAGLGLLLVAGGASAQSGAPTLPARHDTMTVAVDGAVIGRGITRWERIGLEQVQIYTWIAALDGDAVTDSLFVDPQTLRPIRQTRVTRDTTYLMHFMRDTVFISRRVGEWTSTSRSLAPQVELYSSSSIDMLAATMPFRTGASRSVLAFYGPPARVGSRWVVLLVRSRVTLGGRSAWRVVANTQRDSTAYWVDERTRQILQMDVFEGPTRVTFRR